MGRLRLAAALLAAAPALGVADARAQFDAIFGGPPRPPASIPGGNRQQPVPADPQPVSPQPSYPPPNYQQPSYPPPSGGRAAPPSAVQSQPLPPPPGVAAVEPPPSQPPLSGLPPQPAAPQGGDSANDQIVAEPSSQKIANNGAVFSGLDKITGRIINFDVAIGETVQFGALQVTPRACYTRPPTETQNTDAFVEVDEVTLQGEVRRIFTGWMFAASPGLHGVEHAIYDVWLTNCKAPTQTVSATPDPPSAAPARPQQSQRPQQPQQKRQPPRSLAPR